MSLINFSAAIAADEVPSAFIEQKRALLYLYRSDFGETATDNDGIHIWAPVISLLGLELDIIDTLSPDFLLKKIWKSMQG